MAYNLVSTTAAPSAAVDLLQKHGLFNVIARPNIYVRYRKVFRKSPLLIVAGEVQRQGVVINLVAEEAVPLAI
ncbi:MAG: hypothetical protein ABI700_01775 [Chloroflexota bacterium]